MSADWLDFTPKTLRRMAVGFAIFAGMAFTSVALSYVGAPPEWNRMNRLADACELGFIACLLADLARARNRRTVITTKEQA